MLTLRSAGPSPFGRKVKMAAKILGLMERIKVEDTDTVSAADSIRKQNPLGKIPALILEDGQALYDSRVIIEYLDYLAGGGVLIPAAPAARYRALTGQALADGLMDAALLQVYEIRFREEAIRSGKWVDHQAGKVTRALATLEAHPPQGPITIAHIATACALGYLDLRFDGKWRADHAGCVAWLEKFARECPAFEATRFVQG
jgi:glutathione S-transferase